MAELPDATHERIKALGAEGDEHAHDGRTVEAIECYEAAWLLLPEPKTAWEAATWILAAIGDTHYLAGEFERSRDALLTAMHCPEAIGNPFLHLRLGQCQFELGNRERAGDELARAFLLAGSELFQDEDPRYLDFVKSILDEPPGGWE
jgi:tetratricopeptide (TPR) repeat protein